MKESRNTYTVPRLSILEAAARFHVAMSTLHDAIRADARIVAEREKPGRKPALTSREENTIFETILAFSDRGVLMLREHIAEEVETYWKRM